MAQFRITGEELIKVLGKAGFVVTRVRGSHHRLKNEDRGLCTTVHCHAGETIGPGLLSKILRDCDLTKDEFQDYVDEL